MPGFIENHTYPNYDSVPFNELLEFWCPVYYSINCSKKGEKPDKQPSASMMSLAVGWDALSIIK